jgi:hypothetical protein
MTKYLLQWQPVPRKKKGCVSYDLWGAPDDFTETIGFGVSSFKQVWGETSSVLSAHGITFRDRVCISIPASAASISHWRRSHRRRTMAVEMDQV